MQVRTTAWNNETGRWECVRSMTEWQHMPSVGDLVSPEERTVYMVHCVVHTPEGAEIYCRAFDLEAELCKAQPKEPRIRPLL